jgi:hypothetical protein
MLASLRSKHEFSVPKDNAVLPGRLVFPKMNQSAAVYRLARKTTLFALERSVTLKMGRRQLCLSDEDYST